MDQVRTNNRDKLINLSPGMTKAEVLAVMGTKRVMLTDGEEINNPYRVEMFEKDGQHWEVILYYTDIKAQDGAITDDELTPIVLRAGKLVGVGWSYWRDEVQRYQLLTR